MSLYELLLLLGVLTDIVAVVLSIWDGFKRSSSPKPKGEHFAPEGKKKTR